MAVTCDSCGGLVNEMLTRCPHCNAKREPAKGIANTKLSQEEVRALLALDPATSPPESRGLLETLILPHPASFGGARTAEIVLTVIASPLIIVGAVSFGMTFRRRRDRRESFASSSGELVPVLAMTAFGGLGMWSVLALAKVATATTLVVIGGMTAALWVRGAIRARGANARSRELMRIDKPVIEPPKVEPATPGDSPRLLR